MCGCVRDTPCVSVYETQTHIHRRTRTWVHIPRRTWVHVCTPQDVGAHTPQDVGAGVWVHIRRRMWVHIRRRTWAHIRRRRTYAAVGGWLRDTPHETRTGTHTCVCGCRRRHSAAAEEGKRERGGQKGMQTQAFSRSGRRHVSEALQTHLRVRGAAVRGAAQTRRCLRRCCSSHAGMGEGGCTDARRRRRGGRAHVSEALLLLSRREGRGGLHRRTETQTRLNGAGLTTRGRH